MSPISLCILCSLGRARNDNFILKPFLLDRANRPPPPQRLKQSQSICALGSTLVSHIFLLSLASDSFYETYKYTPASPILSQCSFESSAFSSLLYPSHPNFQNVAASHRTAIQLAHPIWNLMTTSFPHLPHSVVPQPGHFTVNAFLKLQLLLPTPSAIILVQISPSLCQDNGNIFQYIVPMM